MENIMNNIVSFAGGFVSLAGILKVYIDKNNIKLASFEKVAEYRELKEVVSVLSKNVSREEFLKIVNYVIVMKKTKESITVDDVATVGKMLFEAVTTEEK